MREENSYETWQHSYNTYARQLQHSYNTYARQLQHSGIDLNASAIQMLCDIEAAKEELIEPTNKYEYILIGR